MLQYCHDNNTDVARLIVITSQIAIFVAAEVFPILASLQSVVLKSLSDDRPHSLPQTALYRSVNETPSQPTHKIDLNSSPSPLPLPNHSSNSRYWQPKHLAVSTSAHSLDKTSVLSG